MFGGRTAELAVWDANLFRHGAADLEAFRRFDRQKAALLRRAKRMQHRVLTGLLLSPRWMPRGSVMARAWHSVHAFLEGSRPSAFPMAIAPAAQPAQRRAARSGACRSCAVPWLGMWEDGEGQMLKALWQSLYVSSACVGRSSASSDGHEHTS